MFMQAGRPPGRKDATYHLRKIGRHSGLIDINSVTAFIVKRPALPHPEPQPRGVQGARRSGLVVLVSSRVGAGHGRIFTTRWSKHGSARHPANQSKKAPGRLDPTPGWR